MKVKVSYTTVVTDNYRRALNSFFGREGLATRQQVKEHLEAYGDSLDEDLLDEYQEEEEEQC